jgi:GNAT superfamily N-acetyltransferase
MIRNVTTKDAIIIMRLVNDAYKIEIGNTGLAFKKIDRYADINQVQDDIEKFDIFLLAELDGKCVGCIGGQKRLRQKRFVMNEPTSKLTYVEFGPFATLPRHQSKGVGKMLMNALYAWCRDIGIDRIVIDVVNHRTDLFTEPNGGFYGKRGFKQIGTVECDAEHNCGKSACTRPSHFILLEKMIR